VHGHAHSVMHMNTLIAHLPYMGREISIPLVVELINQSERGSGLAIELLQWSKVGGYVPFA
jgi:hypothetical protein